MRGLRVVMQVFSRNSKFAYCATTKTEFEETLSQFFGAGNDGGLIDQLLADIDSPFKNDALDDSSHKSAEPDNEFAKFGNKVIIDAWTKRCLTAILTPCLAEPKGDIRFKIDSTLMPHI